MGLFSNGLFNTGDNDDASDSGHGSRRRGGSDEPARPVRSARGYGKLDAKLSRELRSARSAREADRIARNDGHRDAGDAIKWLNDRS